MLTGPSYKIQICCGTMCYIMGGAELHLLQDSLPESIKDQVKIEGVPCLGNCKKSTPKEHPCVLINNVLIKNASITKIINHLLTDNTK